MNLRRLTPQEVKPLIVGGQVIMLHSFKSGTLLDEEGICEHTNWIIENGLVEGVGVLTVGGGNGECFSMSLDERILPVNNFFDGAGPYQSIASAKETARLAGRPISSFERLPLLPISEERRIQLRQLMQKNGMLDDNQGD